MIRFLGIILCISMGARAATAAVASPFPYAAAPGATSGSGLRGAQGAYARIDTPRLATLEGHQSILLASGLHSSKLSEADNKSLVLAYRQIDGYTNGCFCAPLPAKKGWVKALWLVDDELKKRGIVLGMQDTGAGPSLLLAAQTEAKPALSEPRDVRRTRSTEELLGRTNAK